MGGEINGLRFGGIVKVCSTNNDEIFDDNILLKSSLPDTTETAIVLGFSDDYKEKLTEEDEKKFKEKPDI